MLAHKRIRTLFCIFCLLCGAQRVFSDDAVLSRPLVIGASLADGFDKEDMFGPKSDALSLDLFLDKAIIAPHEKIQNVGNMTFFMAPDAIAEEQILHAEKYKPTAVFAPDFLFWFVYGEIDGEESDRLLSLEVGLKSLERLNSFIVVGTIPDASESGGGILDKSQIPKVETIKKANIRIKEWAAAKKKVGIIDLHALLETLRKGQELKSGGIVVPADEAKGYLQADKLHLSEKGVRFISLACLDQLQQISNFDKAAVNWKGK